MLAYFIFFPVIYWINHLLLSCEEENHPGIDSRRVSA
jgi:hypothetical protein